MQWPVKAVILFLFFLSGTTGLIYEVLWIRMFGLVLGNTTYAISITLGAFFTGLAIGGYFFGRYVDSIGNAVGTNKNSGMDIMSPNKVVSMYGYLELGIGVSALLVVVGISAMQELFIWVNQNINSSVTVINIIRFLLSFLLLLIPTTLMGATLPVISKFIIRQYHNIGSGVGMIYGINTLGAAIGCLLTGFYLIRTFGVSTTVYTAVIINLFIGVLILVLERSGFFNGVTGTEDIKRDAKVVDYSGYKQAENRQKSIKKDEHTFTRSTQITVLILFGLIGFTSIAYEIVWTRMLSSIFLNSIYSFTTMLVTFLCGLSIGAAISLKLLKKNRDPLFLLSIVEFAVGISAILLIFLFNSLPGMSQTILMFLQAKTSVTWNLNVCAEFILAFMVMIVPCILIGITLPAGSMIITKEVRLLGRGVGNVYSINTVGGILGAALAGCILIPFMGIKFSELTLAGLNIVAGGVFFLCACNLDKTKDCKFSPLKKIIIPTFLLAAVISGIFCSLKDIRVWDTDGELLYYKEDAAATVSVVKEKDGNKKLIVNKKYTLGTSRAVALQKRMGYFPLLLHKNPKDVLVIGMGTGITLSAAVSYKSTKTVKCIEVISSVAHAAKKFFAEENNRAGENDKVEIIIDDGRNFLLVNKDKYDVIMSDLFVPYHAGAGSLYAKEHFKICKERINDDGLFCQWLPLYQMSSNEFKIICRTFLSVFPQATLWFCNFEKGFICGLIGTRRDLQIDFAALKENMNESIAKNQYKEAMFGSPEEVLSLFITDEIGLKSFTVDSQVNTDNYPIIEFTAPKNLYRFLQNAQINNPKAKLEDKHIGVHNLSVVTGIKKNILPLSFHDKSRGSKLNDMVIAGGSGSEAEIKNIGYYSDAAFHLAAGMLHFYNGEFAAAEDDFLTAWELAPEHLYLRKMFLDLSVRLYQNGNYSETIFINEKLLQAELKDINPFIYFYLGLAYQAQGRVDSAISAYKSAISLDPPNKEAIHYNLGILYRSQGAIEKAMDAFEKAGKKGT